MGTPEFAVPSLAACTELGEVVLVVTQPDKPKGRGQALAAPPVKQWALAHGLAVAQPEKLKATRFHEQLLPLAPEVAVVAAYGKILPPEMLAVPTRGCVNVHGSLLPRWRGAAPIQWAVASGDPTTGVCLMLMEAGLDTGPVIACREMAIGPSDTGGTMHDKLALLGADLLRSDLPAYLAGERTPAPQDHARATLAPILRKENGRLDFRLPAPMLEARLRGFTPWPGGYTTVSGKLLKVLKATAGQGRGEPGVVLSASSAGLEVACAQGSLVLHEVLPEGKRAMSTAQYLSGHPLESGARLG
ncbi:MAG: methionyl-tRNA formyltransferase [Deltaproteobacteria bacterium]|nr:methionyl-tRNA formyltransferase [Deltaproteobacteria bacterium]